MKTKVAKTEVEVAAPTTGAPTYSLNEKAQLLAAQGANAGPTLQRSAPGFGVAWRANGKTAPNTRAQALAAIGAIGAPFTAEEAQKALAEMHKAGILGSGTPRSYVAAFIKNGYFVPAE
jgi:hypothetical protein